MNRVRGLTLLQAQAWTGTLTALAGFFACAVSGELGPAWLIGVPLALLAAESFRGRAGKLRMDWLWTAGLAATLFTLAALVVLGRVDIVLAAVRFVLLLLVHRAWHRRTEGDEQWLLLLSLLALCGAAALSAELLFGVAFLAFGVFATWALALTHLRFEIAAGRGPEGSAALLQSRRIASPALLGGLAVLSLLGLVGSAAVFTAFPRVSLGSFHRRVGSAQRVAGLGERVELTGHGVLGEDPRIVLRVRFEPPLAGDPPRLEAHWRARSLEMWTGRGWEARAGDVPQPWYGPLIPAPDSGRGRHITRAVEVEAVAGFTDGVVLTPDGWPLGVEFRRPFTAIGASQHLLRTTGGDLFYQPVETGDLRYAVSVDETAVPRKSLRGRGRDYPRWVAPDLVVPDDLDPRVRALAAQLTAGKDPVDAALAVESHLARFTYSRELDNDVRDPLTHFLFERRSGHCELFSSAMVLLLRAGGIPARNVTGYYGGRLARGGYYAVRAGDAHSWVEVFFPGHGFAAFDPTPPSERGGPSGGAWARLVLLWDGLQEGWRRFVVDYDLLSQVSAARKLAHAFDGLGARLAGKGGPQLRAAPALLRAVGVAGLLALGALALRWWRRRGRPQGQGRALSPSQRRARRLFAQLRSEAARLGLEVRPGSSSEALARALGERVPEAVDPVRRAARTAAAARWGEAPLAAEAARALSRELREALHRGR